MYEQTVRSHNLANASTTGFKADLANALSKPVIGGDGLPSRIYALTSTPHTNLSIGPMIDTGRDLDVAIEGEGWIAVQSPDGTRESYTRAGNLSIDTLGLLRDHLGNLVLGNGGPISIPDSEKVEIGTDGTITVRALGQGPEAVSEIDRIKLVKVDDEDLYKEKDGLLYSVNGFEEADATVHLRKGFLETSNVNTVTELTSIITLARQFESQVQLMQTIDENAQASASLLQVQV